MFHDHFTGDRHGGVAVFEVRSEREEARLGEHGPLDGWLLSVHGLTFALSGVGFAEQTEFTLETYGGTTLDALRDAEQADPRFWWRKPREMAD